MISFFKPRSSIKYRVTLFTLIIFVVGIWSLSFYANRTLRADFQEVLSNQQFSAASYVASVINRDIEERIRTLETIAGAAAPYMKKGAADMQTYLDQSRGISAQFNAGIVAVGPDGVSIADVPSSMQRVGLNLLDRDHIIGALKDGKTTIGKPVMGKKMLAPLIAVAVPIRDAQGKVIGALSGLTDLEKPNFLDNISGKNYGKTGGYLLVASSHRIVVTATDKRRVMDPLPAPGVNPQIDRFVAGYEGSGIFVDPLGISVLASAKSVALANWYVAATLPTEEAFAPINALQRHIILATILLTLLAAGITLWLLRRELAPMVETAKTLAALTHSSQPALPLPLVGNTEIDNMINGFNQLLKVLVQREAALRDSEYRWKFAIEGAGDGLWDWNIQTGKSFYSSRYKTMLGFTEEEIGDAADEWSKRIHPQDAPGVQAALQPYLNGKPGNAVVEFRMLCKDGSWMWTLGRGIVVMRDANGKALRMIGTNSDITSRKLAEAKLQLAANVFDYAREGIIITDTDGTIVDINQAFSRITGYSREEAIGQNTRILKSGRQNMPFYESMWAALTVQGHWSGEVWNRRKNGEVYAELLTISAIRDGRGDTKQYVGLFSDITGIKEHQRQLEHIAHFDALTNLPNRLLLADRLQQAMVHALRRGQKVGVAYLDIDGFKGVNDQHGHDVGDKLLMHLASAMKDSLREGDTLARLGGDEFVAVLIDLDDIESSVPLLNRLLEAAAAPVQFGEMVLQGSASIGVAFFPQAHNLEADQLLRQADQAMYQAKLAGKNRYQVFDADHDSSIRVQHEKLDCIRLALARDEFVLHYQPKVNMRSGKIIGAEALIRWQHPEMGLLSPAAFLPVIEDHPLAIEVGEWVINTALTQVEAWQDMGLDITVSVNIAALQLQQIDFVQRLKEVLAKHGRVNPSSLELEVLETSALADMEQAAQVIEDCHQIGVRFALDDFGTGYSSLTYLKRLRVALLKIDQSFVRDMLVDPDDLAILEGVIGLAAAFKREVIAEGVETVAHGTALLDLGCELAQGYGIARPMPADQFPTWAILWHPDDAWHVPHSTAE